METKEYLKMLRKIKNCAFATVDENGMPDVRIIDVMMAEDDGLYFLTARGKNFYRQVRSQEFVAITGMTKNWEMVSLRGRVKQVSQDYLTPIFENNPSMNDVYPGDSRSILEVFCLFEGQGEYFNLSQTPVFRQTFFVGRPEEQKKGFHITEGCISCGLCAEGCPQSCIEAGTPYTIRQEHCLHCGLCAETCPVTAIDRYPTRRPAMKIKIVKGDITQISADAIVNAANETLLGGGGVDGAIHRAAGPELLKECAALHGCKTGQAKITKGYRLPAKYVIHTPGPVWHGGGRHEAELLKSCYESCMRLAHEYGVRTIAFPSISTGVYHFPLQQAAEIAMAAIAKMLGEDPDMKEAVMVCFDDKTKNAYDEALEKIIQV